VLARTRSWRYFDRLPDFRADNLVRAAYQLGAATNRNDQERVLT